MLWFNTLHDCAYIYLCMCQKAKYLQDIYPIYVYNIVPPCLHTSVKILGKLLHVYKVL